MLSLARGRHRAEPVGRVELRTGDGRISDAARSSWEPVIVTGRWLTDDWGRAWLAVEDVRQ